VGQRKELEGQKQKCTGGRKVKEQGEAGDQSIYGNEGKPGKKGEPKKAPRGKEDQKLKKPEGQKIDEKKRRKKTKKEHEWGGMTWCLKSEGRGPRGVSGGTKGKFAAWGRGLLKERQKGLPSRSRWGEKGTKSWTRRNVGLRRPIITSGGQKPGRGPLECLQKKYLYRKGCKERGKAGQQGGISGERRKKGLETGLGG